MERQFADFIEEERAAVRPAKEPLAGLACPREGSLGMAKQLAFNERLRQAGTICSNQRPSGTGTPLVDQLRNHLLAGPALAQNQNRRIGWCHDSRSFKDMTHGWAFAD